MDLPALKHRLHKGLIVSCQALPGEPLFGAGMMAAMARAAVSAGAVAIRANGPADIAAIRAEVQVPIIGIYKVDMPGFEVRITPTLEHALQVAEAGADLIALDATRRPHPEGDVAELIEQIHRRTGLPVLADISTLEEGLAAAAWDAEFVGTTLSGYTVLQPRPAGSGLCPACQIWWLRLGRRASRSSQRDALPRPNRLPGPWRSARMPWWLAAPSPARNG